MGWIKLAPVTGGCGCGNEHSCSIKLGTVLAQLSDYLLLK